MTSSPDFDVLQHAALEATRGWTSAKASMALRAAGLDSAEGGRASLDAIAADLGVSRETVRRARNDLLHAMRPPRGTTSQAIYSSLSLSAPSEPSAESPATARALRRLLTMTGPLLWDEVLSAWARAGGKPPYSPLPTDLATMRAWASETAGFTVSAANWAAGPVTIATVLPEELDQVSQFLLDALREQPGGVDRNVLLELAEAAGLKATTIATTLSMHPAVMRLGRGMWALRGRRPSRACESAGAPEPRRTDRVRPTTFTWSSDGSLLIEFSVPRGPSPVVAVPKAVFEIIEGREFTLNAGDKPLRITVRQARMWGFGPLISELSLPGGARVTIALNLIAGTATITPAEGKDASR
ncbi:hypothetical protein [Actinoplanes sp. NPDC020271]|uniref:hypothetical protein n=1 Tax=Actinoplanes sp. NPDC020271 TaxID=3363896 RepID=UPI00378E8AEF